VLVRELTTGLLTWESAVAVVYLVALVLVGLTIVRAVRPRRRAFGTHVR
jgi:lipooligosaccharide transport system permease protein